jgi:hypothetical protein
MPGLLHERAVEEILKAQPTAKRHGFGAAVRDILEPYQIEEAPGGVWRAHVIPDAYLLDHENEVVVAYEVEDSNRLSADKLNRYVGLAWEINEPYWELVVIVGDRWGNMYAILPRILDIEDAVVQAAKKRKLPTHGPCPCCGRQFLNLASHVRLKHPDYLVDGLMPATPPKVGTD